MIFSNPVARKHPIYYLPSLDVN